ncbi:MAG: thioredoxin-disulfide reductase [Syntrophales bacterium]|jgi:thioredoxin reductase (NADPH)|nr:thioredoxin-disulfide reductase [Syntrophales bacterium]MDY0045432.1 thioredoxin-disulfide reductase [Syntrophales bacterium]
MAVNMPENVQDLVIIGGGPAGLTAGLYASRAGMKTVILEGKSTVSQITVTDSIENYPGIPEVSGFELHDRFRTQAVSFGAYASTDEARSVEKILLGEYEGWKITTEDTILYSLSVIIATGAKWRALGVPGEEQFLGRGVSYCATCDGPFYKKRKVAVVGGGDTAIQEAVFLTKFADKVTVIHRRDKLRAAKILQKRAFANDKIEFEWNSVVQEVEGQDFVTSLRLKNLKNLEQDRKISVDGVFVFIGLDPITDFIKGVVNLDIGGYIIADALMRTSEPGIFACGDCIAKPLRQVITACGDGATAAHEAQLYVDELKGQAY